MQRLKTQREFELDLPARFGIAQETVPKPAAFKLRLGLDGNSGGCRLPVTERTLANCLRLSLYENGIDDRTKLTPVIVLTHRPTPSFT
jgi:hypothetical protein